MKIMDKLKNAIVINKKMIICLIVIVLVGIITGSLLVAVLNESDKNLVTEYINMFFNNIKDNKLNYIDTLKNSIISNMSLIIVIWLLGISIIGVPIITFLYFCKSFILGFSLSSIIMHYKIKGCLIAFLYIFPHQIINIIMLTILMTYALSLSFKLISSFFKKKTIDFKIIMKKYLVILLFSLLISIISSLLEVFLMPKLIKMVIPLIK